MKFAIYILAFFLLSGLVSIAQIHKKPTVSSVVSKDPLDYYLKALKLKDDSLPAKKIKLIPDSSKYKPEKFFIAQVEDSTKGNDSIGFTLQPKTGKKQKIIFEKGTIATFTDYIQKSVTKDSTLYPLSLRIVQLNIDEERQQKIYDKASLRYKYEFVCYWKNKALLISSLSGEGFMRTPLSQKKNYDSIVSSTIHDVWKKVDNIMAEEADKNPDFCKGVKVIATVKTDNNKMSDSIFYDGHYELQWDDYRGNSNQNDAIESYVGLLMQPDFNYKNGILEISVNVGTYFSKGFSWVKGNAQQPKVLLHEQYRMRLAHYYTLQLKKKLEKASLTYENYAKNIQQIYHDINDAANVEMRQYDSETKFGITKKEQEKWQKKIEDELSSAENQSN